MNSLYIDWDGKERSTMSDWHYYFQDPMVAKMISSDDYQQGYTVGFNSGYQQGLKEASSKYRADAIDEFLEALIDKSEYFSVGNKIVESIFISTFTKIAEQLKEKK